MVMVMVAVIQVAKELLQKLEMATMMLGMLKVMAIAIATSEYLVKRPV